MSVYEKLKELGIVLEPLKPPVAAFVPYVRTGNLVFVSGNIAIRDGKPWKGKLGAEITTAEGKEAARSVAVELISVLHAATGDLNRVTRIVKLMALVNSTTEFTEQSQVANGASELFVQVFGDRGAHARAAFGTAQVPAGACVEIELIAEVQGD